MQNWLCCQVVAKTNSHVASDKTTPMRPRSIPFLSRASLFSRWRHHYGAIDFLMDVNRWTQYTISHPLSCARLSYAEPLPTKNPGRILFGLFNWKFLIKNSAYSPLNNGRSGCVALTLLMKAILCCERWQKWKLTLYVNQNVYMRRSKVLHESRQQQLLAPRDFVNRDFQLSWQL